MRYSMPAPIAGSCSPSTPSTCRTLRLGHARSFPASPSHDDGRHACSCAGRPGRRLSNTGRKESTCLADPLGSLHERVRSRCGGPPDRPSRDDRRATRDHAGGQPPRGRARAGRRAGGKRTATRAASATTAERSRHRVPWGARRLGPRLGEREREPRDRRDPGDHRPPRVWPHAPNASEPGPNRLREARSRRPRREPDPPDRPDARVGGAPSSSSEASDPRARRPGTRRRTPVRGPASRMPGTSGVRIRRTARRRRERPVHAELRSSPLTGRSPPGTTDSVPLGRTTLTPSPGRP